MTEIMLADAAAAHDLRYVALRYFNVAGADPQGRAGQSTPRATHLIKVACETALGKRGHMQVFGTDYPTRDGTCVRDYIHVTDLTRAHLAALRHLRAGGASDVFNCGYGRGYSVLEVIDAVKRASGRSFDVRLGPRRPGDPAVVIAATERIRKLLEWVPLHDRLDAIVFQALRWEERLSDGDVPQKGRITGWMRLRDHRRRGNDTKKAGAQCRQLGKRCVSSTNSQLRARMFAFASSQANAAARLRVPRAHAPLC